MKNIKILLTRSLLDIDKKYISDKLRRIIGDKFNIVEPEDYNEEAICDEIKGADVLLGPFVTKRMLEKADNLKLIQIPWTGVNTFNFNAVKKSDVPVCNSHSNSDAVAEMGIALLLDLIKKVSYHDRKMRCGNWNRDQKPLNLKSGLVANKVICILGYGSIGRKTGKIIKAFGSKIIGVANHMHDYDEVSKFYKASEWEKAVADADICLCTLPLTDKSRGLINTKTIRNFKRGSLIINMSRAEIIKEEAIYNALVDEHIKGYASDVWWNTPKRGESESYVSAHYKFEELDNVVLSAHRAGYIEGCLPHLDDAIINIANLAQNKPLVNYINIKKEY